MYKQASFGEQIPKILTMLGTGVAIGGGVAGVGFLIDQVRKMKRDSAVPRYFKDMLARNPDVKMHYSTSKENKQQTEDLFMLLEHFAPKIVENPTASGTFLRQLIKYQDLGATTEMIETLSKITKNYSDASGQGLGPTAANKLFSDSAAFGLGQAGKQLPVKPDLVPGNLAGSNNWIN